MRTPPSGPKKRALAAERAAMEEARDRAAGAAAEPDDGHGAAAAGEPARPAAGGLTGASLFGGRLRPAASAGFRATEAARHGALPAWHSMSPSTPVDP